MKLSFCLFILMSLTGAAWAAESPPLPSKRTFQVFAPATYMLGADELQLFAEGQGLQKLGYALVDGEGAYAVQNVSPAISGENTKIKFSHLLAQIGTESGILAILGTHGNTSEIDVEFFPPLANPQQYNPAILSSYNQDVQYNLADNRIAE